MSMSSLSSLSDIENSSADERRRVNRRIHRPRTFLNRNDPFNIYNDIDFKSRYRVNKATFMELLHLMHYQLEPQTRRNKSISTKLQLLVTLRFYATGAFQRVIGDHIQIHKSSVSRIICRVTRQIASLKPQYICMPNDTEKSKVILDFYNIQRFPKVIGAMDCSHVPIPSPGGPNAELFRNRKGFFSINVQVICDARLKIRNLIARWSGSVHDSTIFNNSPVCAEFEAGEYGSNYFLGDNGYSCKKFLLTPLLNPQGRSEQTYNQAHIATRNVIERCFEVLKRRFPCLSKGMAINLETTLHTIVACTVLHNICDMNGDVADFENIVEIEEPELHPAIDNNTAIRSALIETVFNR